MPTCDASPQNKEWLLDYSLSDSVMTYTDWALELFNKESNGKIKTVCSTPPGADTNTFIIRPKIQQKQNQ